MLASSLAFAGEHFTGSVSCAEVTVTTTEAMPTQSVPTETGVPRGGEGAKVERELSRGESVESFRSDRSFTEESETKLVALQHLCLSLLIRTMCVNYFHTVYHDIHSDAYLLSLCPAINLGPIIRHYSRKRKAKKSRETRKKTQPVPADLFEQLSQMVEGGGEGEKVKQEVERERKQFVEQLTSAALDSTVSQQLCCVVERSKHN